MWLVTTVLCVLTIISCHITNGQLPPRLSIPGAVLVSRPGPFRQQRIQPEALPQRPRRPVANAIPAPIRPVVEEAEEPQSVNNFDDEVNKLGISALQSAVRQVQPEEDNTPRPVQFRPERPIPLLRENVREQRPVLRQEQVAPSRPVLRQDVREDLPVPVRQPTRHAQPRPVQAAPQPVRQPHRGAARPQSSQYADDEEERPRNRKPQVQILRKYRTDNADGSITWGFENDDGTFKEETLGVDCITRGKYGYIDPDGVRREYSYETGNKCDEPEEEEEQILQARPPQQPQGAPRKPIYRP